MHLRDRRAASWYCADRRECWRTRQIAELRQLEWLLACCPIEAQIAERDQMDDVMRSYGVDPIPPIDVWPEVVEDAAPSTGVAPMPVFVKGVNTKRP